MLVRGINEKIVQIGAINRQCLTLLYFMSMDEGKDTFFWIISEPTDALYKKKKKKSKG